MTPTQRRLFSKIEISYDAAVADRLRASLTSTGDLEGLARLDRIEAQSRTKPGTTLSATVRGNPTLGDMTTLCGAKYKMLSNAGRVVVDLEDSFEKRASKCDMPDSNHSRCRLVATGRSKARPTLTESPEIAHERTRARELAAIAPATW